VAGTKERTSLAADDRAIPDLWQAGMLLTGTVMVYSLCDVACVISERVAADRIRASPEVVVAPVTVPSSSA
jgi:hypothetical protein